MSASNEVWGKWDGKLVDGKFPLQGWLGGSNHSIVFLTERADGKPQKAAVKLIPAENPNSQEQLSLWAEAATLSHPHLIRVFEHGLCQIDGIPVLYVVTEYAEENLSEVVPLRALSPAEVSEMLGPAAEALAALHRSGLVHSRIKPSNVMAINNELKLSADGIRRTGEGRHGPATSAYDAPELASAAFSPAADIWSLGMTLVSVLTQSEPKGNAESRPAMPERIPQSLQGILQRCLQVDPAQRCTANDILKQISTEPIRMQAGAGTKQVLESHAPQSRAWGSRPRRWIAVPIAAAALFIVAWIGGRFLHQPTAPVSESSPLNVQHGNVSNPQTPAAASGKESVGQQGTTRGSVLHQVLPEVSRGALRTIRGRLKVSVQVGVDASGNVSQANLISPGPSRYFATRAQAAARQWKFTPPQVEGQPAASDWVLRFQFGPTAIQVFPSEIKP